MTPLQLSKDMIFSHATPEDIYLKFLNLPELPKGNISSPFSEDKKPSFKLYSNGSFKCNSTGKQGDVFQLVADLNQLDCKTQFQEILNVVAKEMNLPLGTLESTRNLPYQPKKSVPKQEKPFVLSVTHTEFENNHIAYWDKLGVQRELLKKYNVRAVSKYSFFSPAKNKELTFVTKDDVLVFSYEVNENFEVYIPAQLDKNQPKKFSNGLKNGDVFGLEQLGTEKIENLIICAGKKDTIVAVSRGFKAVTFRSETHNPTISQIKTLQSYCQHLYICYDNDNGGINGRNKIIDKYPETIPLTLPQVYNDLTDYFQEKSASDFQNIIDVALKGKNESIVEEQSEKWTIFHVAEKYLTENYDIRLNVISNDIEISKKYLEDWTSLNENSIYRELQKKSIKIPKLSLISILMSDFVPQYNPLIQYFEKLPKWDEDTDYIKQFTQYVKLAPGENEEHFIEQFKKWCVRVVKCATIDGYFNKEAFILTDDGIGQSMGKTSWCRFLCPPQLSHYIAENISTNEKDARISLCKNLFINLDELDSMNKMDVNKLKSFFSTSQINDRLPYDKKNSTIQRVASFLGSTNMTNFLHDETGSVRWICFIAEGINWEYKSNFDINTLWSQAVHLAKDLNFIETISKDEILINESRNEKFQIISPERDLINRLFKFSNDVTKGEFLSATDIAEHIHLWSSGIKVSCVAVGKAMRKIGYKKDRLNQEWGYWVIKKDTVLK
ncbi:VapE domain-containing protein [Flavobacterium xueshanense]|uniref:Virulence-associated protein E n=1 Tax=Flavobacterium xueshanense TaxID=935223 RepID=A0A1I2H0C3_9FLAO|nr:VapE domain-containing protein [Flavobacterium xueshanense]SFF22860.1 Virulence-associated protein E [Flavobacterium xueshanense]